MKILLSVIAFAFSLTTVFADDPKELIEVRKAWEQSKEKAVSSINAKYKEYLLSLKARFTNAGDRDSVLAIDKEISNLDKPVQVSSVQTVTVQANAADDSSPFGSRQDTLVQVPSTQTEASQENAAGNASPYRLPMKSLGHP